VGEATSPLASLPEQLRIMAKEDELMYCSSQIKLQKGLKEKK
jgi:hypothetical protein